MASILAPIPRFIFTVFEPLSLVAGFAVPILNPSYFVSLQVPSQAPSAVPYNLTPTDRILALQLANTYGLLCMVGVGVLYATTEPKVVRNYLIACAIADVGHGWATGAVMGWEDFVNVGVERSGMGKSGCDTVLVCEQDPVVCRLVGQEH